jgi:hemolysin activation/secretion protein
LGSLIVAGNATAQRVTPPVTREELNPAARAGATPAPKRDLFQPEAAAPCPLRSSMDQFELRTVTFQGLTAVKPQELSPLYQDQIGKRIPVGAICDIRDAVTRALFDRGVLARVNIPEQTISQGQLTLEVIEAHVVNVRLRGDVGPAQDAVARYLNHLRGMAPFDMRKAQRYLLLASDVPGVTLHAAIAPSASGERGAVDLDVTVSRDAVDALVNIQNLGAEDLGRWGGLLRGDFNSFTALGEKSTLVFYHSLANNEQWVAQGFEEFRLGGEGLLGRLSFAYGHAQPGGDIAPLDLVSRSYVGEAELSYPIVRMRRQNLNIAGGLDIVDQVTDVAGFELSKDKLRVLYLRLDGNRQAEVFDRPLAFAGAIQLRKGLDALGASTPDSFELSRLNAEPQAWVWRANGSFAATLATRLTLSGQVIAQYSAQPLLPYEQLTFGNLTIGRGYDPGVVGGDSGAGGEVVLRYGPIAPHPKVICAPYVFYDYGYAHRHDFSDRDEHVSAAGLGVQMRLFQRISVDIAYAWPLTHIGVTDFKPPSRLLFNLTTTLD